MFVGITEGATPPGAAISPSFDGFLETLQYPPESVDPSKVFLLQGHDDLRHAALALVRYGSDEKKKNKSLPILLVKNPDVPLDDRTDLCIQRVVKSLLTVPTYTRAELLDCLAYYRHLGRSIQKKNHKPATVS